jgi:hypothetical protein
MNPPMMRERERARPSLFSQLIARCSFLTIAVAVSSISAITFSFYLVHAQWHTPMMP